LQCDRKGAPFLLDGGDGLLLVEETGLLFHGLAEDRQAKVHPWEYSKLLKQSINQPSKILAGV
jgi:hypothetical protein